MKWLLVSHQSGAEEWSTYYRYNDNLQLLYVASPSSVMGYDEGYHSLVLPDNPSDPFYLRSDAGLIRSFAYHADSGYTASESVQEGLSGSPTKLYDRDYCFCPTTCTCGSSSSSSAQPSSSSSAQSSSSFSSGSSSSPVNRLGVWLLSGETIYPGDGAPQTTTYCYTFFPGTCAIQEIKTTLPTVATEQNGTGIAATRREVFDQYRNRLWAMDERGFIRRWDYDVPTGALIAQVDDVDTTLYSDVPAGWQTPAGGGQNLITDLEHDFLGRIIQSLGPSHSVDISGTARTLRRASWTVFDDHEHITYNGVGYELSGTLEMTLINPVSIAKMDAGGRINEQIQAVAPETDGTLQDIIDEAGGGASAFPQSSFTRWTTFQYTDCCLAASMRVYHSIPISGEGASGTNYDETDYGYDVMKRRNRTVSPGGTISFQVYDARGLVSAVYIGTDDSGSTNEDPTGGGLDPDNNMKVVAVNVFDHGEDGGNGYLTQQTQYVTASDTRMTAYCYDFRGRRIATVGEVDFFQCDTFDNLDRVVKSERYDTIGPCCGNSSSSSSSGGTLGKLIARSETKYDARGRVYQTIRYGVDPTTGTVGNALIDNSWYDAAGNLLATVPSGASLFTKSVYDSLGRTTVQYTGFNADADPESPLGNGTPESVDEDVILEQSESDYDQVSNLIETRQRQRYHNADEDDTGALLDPDNAPKARVTYAAMYPDVLGRTQASVNYGTNGGSALSRPDTIPARSDTVLVSSSQFNNAGELEQTRDPKGMITVFEYDQAGRRITLIENFGYLPSSGSSSSSSSTASCSPSDDLNRTTRLTYTPDGEQATLTAENLQTGNQTTTYTYGTTLSNSEIATSTLLRSVTYPDSSGGSDVVSHTYNRQGQRVTTTDQRGCVHTYLYDKLGRLVHDCVTTVGTGVDSAVRRLSISYEVRGLPSLMTSYDNSTVGSGNTLNQVQQEYNDFGQSTAAAQSHAGAVTP